MVSLIGLWTTRPWCGKLHEYRGQSFFYFVRIAVPLVIIISIRAVLLRLWRHLLQFSTIETRKINCSAKFSEIKDQKTCALYFVIDWNLARYLGKAYCVRKSKKKMDLENLIIRALATSDEQSILDIPATDEIHMEDRNHGLAWTKPNNEI